ncbi:hypothetical protein CEXT_17401 [Caerostris extrusa]|uniref:Uncharacterized protein n=1 Tax=Caerostris extrusa TaxID=172846 RepID=A0AAV4U2J5_CAEEX|nr:hypothetical protein CEXT_17401 [Caerostris extrusa]
MRGQDMFTGAKLLALIGIIVGGSVRIGQEFITPLQTRTRPILPLDSYCVNYHTTTRPRAVNYSRDFRQLVYYHSELNLVLQRLRSNSLFT